MDAKNKKYAIFLMGVGGNIIPQFFDAYPELLVDKYNSLTPDELANEGIRAYALANFEDAVWKIVDGSWEDRYDLKIIENYIDGALNKFFEEDTEVKFRQENLEKAKKWIIESTTKQALLPLVKKAIVRDLSLIPKMVSGSYVAVTDNIEDKLEINDIGITDNGEIYVDVAVSIEAEIFSQEGDKTRDFVKLVVPLNYYLYQFEDVGQVDVTDFKGWAIDRHNMKIEV